MGRTSIMCFSFSLVLPSIWFAGGREKLALQTEPPGISKYLKPTMRRNSRKVDSMIQIMNTQLSQRPFLCNRPTAITEGAAPESGRMHLGKVSGPRMGSLSRAIVRYSSCTLGLKSKQDAVYISLSCKEYAVYLTYIFLRYVPL